MAESTVARAERGWVRYQQTRYRTAAWLAVPGAVVWILQAFAAWMQSQEGKWQDNGYLSVGGAEVAADDLLTFLAVAFLLIAGLLGYGAALLLRDRMSGRYPVLAGAWLVVLGQLFAGVLAAIPIDEFHHSPPANLVFLTPLVVFPLLVILCLTEVRRSDG